MLVRNKIWKTYNKSLVILDVAGFDMQNKYKFITKLLNFDVETIVSYEQKDKDVTHKYSS